MTRTVWKNPLMEVSPGREPQLICSGGRLRYESFHIFIFSEIIIGYNLSKGSLFDEKGVVNLSNEISVQSIGSSQALDNSLASTSVASRVQSRKRILKSSKMSTPMTPRIMISKCEKLEKLVEVQEAEVGKTARKVLRGKIKSPVSRIQKSIMERNLKSKERIESYESQLRKKESEILSLTRKVNGLQKTVNEKDKSIKGLEKKFPKMISDLKQGLIEEKKANVEMKEFLKKYRQVNGDKHKMEEQLKVKEDKIKEFKQAKKRLMEDLKSKDLELSEFRKRLQALEEKVPKMLEEIQQKDQELQSKDEDLVRFEETVEFLEQRLSVQAEDQRCQEKLIDDLKRRLNMFCEELEEKETELLNLKESHQELQLELQDQYDALERTDQETKNYLQIIDSIREKLDTAPATAVEKLHNSIDYLDKATEDFLDRVSSVSKKKNINFKVKLTISKNRPENFGKANDTFDSIILNPNSFNNNVSKRLSFNNIQHSSRNSGRMSQGQDTPFRPFLKTSFNQSRASFEDSRKQLMIPSCTNDFNDDVFVEGGEPRFRSSMAESSVNTETSRSDYDVSSDTCNRLEELDNKVKCLWNRLSTASEVYQSSTKVGQF